MTSKHTLTIDSGTTLDTFLKEALELREKMGEDGIKKVSYQDQESYRALEQLVGTYVIEQFYQSPI